MSFYLMAAYGSAKLRRWFEQEYRKAGRKLDMDKSCVRFESVDDLALDVVGKAEGQPARPSTRLAPG
jgi:hypothetical protein